MTPPPRLSYEDRERRHWSAFWQEVPAWAKTAIIALGTAAATSYASGGTPKEMQEQIRTLQLNDIKKETQLDSMQRQLDRIERLLERRLGPAASRAVRSEAEG